MRTSLADGTTSAFAAATMRRVERIGLTPDEHNDGKALLRNAMARTQRVGKSPTWRWTSFSHRAPLLTVISSFFVVSGCGIAWASQASVPGELLYPVKVDIVEPLIGRFHTTPQARAEWSVRLLQERLREMEVVLVRGGTRTQMDDQLQTIIDSAATKTSNKMHDLPESEANEHLQNTVRNLLNEQQKNLLRMPRTTHTIRMLRVIQSLQPKPSAQPRRDAPPTHLSQPIKLTRPSRTSSSMMSVRRSRASSSLLPTLP